MSIVSQLYAARWLLISAVVVVYGVSKYRVYKRLSAFKGPFSTGWSELWHVSWILGTRGHLAYQEVNKKYGQLLVETDFDRSG
jgi:hypothetical protein